MKNILVLALFSMLLSSCAPDTTCVDFKTGVFEYTHPDYKEWKITRTDSLQKEISSKSGVEIISTIAWETDCKYILTYKEIKNSKNTDLLGSKIYVEILETGKNKYTCHSKSESLNLDLELEMKRIE